MKVLLWFHTALSEVAILSLADITLRVSQHHPFSCGPDASPSTHWPPAILAFLFYNHSKASHLRAFARASPQRPTCSLAHSFHKSRPLLKHHQLSDTFPSCPI